MESLLARGVGLGVSEACAARQCCVPWVVGVTFFSPLIPVMSLRTSQFGSLPSSSTSRDSVDLKCCITAFIPVYFSPSPPQTYYLKTFLNLKGI